MWLNSKNLKLPGSRKLSARWIGLFEVESTSDSVAYRIALPSYLSCLHPVFHVSLLKPVHVAGDGTTSMGPSPM